MLTGEKQNKSITNILEDLPINVHFDIETLNMFCAYSLTTDNELINRTTLNSAHRLFSKINKTSYQYDEQSKVRFEFIKNALDIRINDCIENVNVLINLTRNNITEKEIFDEIVSNVQTRYILTTAAVKHINELIVEKLNYGFIYSLGDNFGNFFEKLQLGDFRNDKEASDIFKELLKNSNHILRKQSSLDDGNRMNLSSGNFDIKAGQMIDNMKKPNNKIRTGVQLLNKLLGGGFEKTRLYLFLGLTGNFKSGLLLSIMKWLKWYNMGYQTTDPEKKPVLLYITQENTLEETVERYFNMTVSSNDIRSFDTNEAIRLLKEKGKLVIDTVNNIDIEMRYYGNETIDTEYLYTIYDELADEGKEVICLIHDYIIRLRSKDSSKRENKDKLGAVANELKNFAIEKKIPVIEAGQLNREGAKVIDSAIEYNKEDLAKLLGRSNVAESWSLMQNVDAAFIINKEYSNLYKRFFLTFSRIKMRYKTEACQTYFNHPFEDGNEMNLLDDIDGEVLSKFSLSNNMEEENASNKSSAVARRKITKSDNKDLSSFDDFDKYIDKKIA